MKIYAKRGASNYKEKRLIRAIEDAIAQKSKTDPNFATNIKPATNFEELKALHDKLCTEDVSYEEVNDEETDIEKKHKEFRDGLAETMEKKSEPSSNPSGFVDPFNDAEPIIRNYVMDDGFQQTDNADENEPVKTTFDEPRSFAESFELPSAEDEKGQTQERTKEKKEKRNNAPINPQFDEMSGAKKRRSTKKFAKIIVEGVCILAEKGCIWWTTKDITEDKLVQYELEGKMDLQILLTLDDSQQITVREWFGHKVKEADVLFKVSKDDKEDLIDSLYEVMLEKGVAPTPMQELMINAVKTFILDMGVKAFALERQIKSVLNQLVEIKNQQTQAYSQTDFDVTPQTHSNPVVDDTPMEVEVEEIKGDELAIVGETLDNE